jgi:hypothetical protein
VAGAGGPRNARSLREEPQHPRDGDDLHLGARGPPELAIHLEPGGGRTGHAKSGRLPVAAGRMAQMAPAQGGEEEGEPPPARHVGEGHGIEDPVVDPCPRRPRGRAPAASERRGGWAQQGLAQGARLNA